MPPVSMDTCTHVPSPHRHKIRNKPFRKVEITWVELHPRYYVRVVLLIKLKVSYLKCSIRLHFRRVPAYLL